MAEPDWIHLAMACLAPHRQAKALVAHWEAFLRAECVHDGETCGQPAGVRVGVEGRALEVKGHTGARWRDMGDDYRDAIDQWVQEASGEFPGVAFAVGLAFDVPPSPDEAAYGWVWWPDTMDQDAGFCFGAALLGEARAGPGLGAAGLAGEEAAMSLAIGECAGALAVLGAPVRAQALDERLPAGRARPNARM